MLLLAGAGPPPELLGDGLTSIENLLRLTHVRIRLEQHRIGDCPGYSGIVWCPDDLLFQVGI